MIKSFGLAPLPDGIFNRTGGRQEAKRLTGSSMVPVLVTDDGEVIKDSKKIVDWARRMMPNLEKHHLDALAGTVCERPHSRHDYAFYARLAALEERYLAYRAATAAN